MACLKHRTTNGVICQACDLETIERYERLNADKNERLRIGCERYDTARRMNPRLWEYAWKLNVQTGKPFDEIIDNLRPFMMGVKAADAISAPATSSKRQTGPG